MFAEARSNARARVPEQQNNKRTGAQAQIQRSIHVAEDTEMALGRTLFQVPARRVPLGFSPSSAPVLLAFRDRFAVVSRSMAEAALAGT